MSKEELMQQAKDMGVDLKKTNCRKKIFKGTYGDQEDVITPDVIGYGWVVLGRIVFELSQGKPRDNERLYSVIVADGTEKSYDDMNRVFMNPIRALEYIKSISNSCVSNRRMKR